MAPGSSRKAVSRRERELVPDGTLVSLSRGVEVALCLDSPDTEDRLPELRCWASFLVVSGAGAVLLPSSGSRPRLLLLLHIQRVSVESNRHIHQPEKIYSDVRRVLVHTVQRCSSRMSTHSNQTTALASWAHHSVPASTSDPSPIKAGAAIAHRSPGWCANEMHRDQQTRSGPSGALARFTEQPRTFTAYTLSCHLASLKPVTVMLIC